MQRIVRPILLTCLTCLLGAFLNGCGGNSGRPEAQNKHASRAVKQAASPYATVVQELYVAYFGRPADPGGLANFENALAGAGAPAGIQDLTAAYASNKQVQSLIDSFGTSKESQTLYGSGSTQDFVTAVFTHVLGRAPLSEGLSYWSGAIDKGTLSKGDAALAIMAGALANTTVQGQVDTALINNRLTVAADFTAELANGSTSDTYSGAAAAGTARSMLSQVGAYTDISQFAAVITSTIGTIATNSPGIHLVAGDIRAGVNLLYPTGMVQDAAGNMYVTDQTNNTVDKITPDGTLTIIAGSPGVADYADGTGTAARFNAPWGIGMDSHGNLFVADDGNAVIRKITPAGVVSTLAGSPKGFGQSDGTGTAASFFTPTGLVIDSRDNIYVADTENSYIRKVTPAGVVTTVIGTGGPCDSIPARGCFGAPLGLTFDAAGNLYVADSYYGTVRKMTTNGVVSIIAGTPGVHGLDNGVGAAATFNSPSAIAVDAAGNIFVSDPPRVAMQYYDMADFTIRKISPDGTVSTFAGSKSTFTQYIDGPLASARFGYVYGLLFDKNGTLYMADSTYSTIRAMDTAGNVSTFVSRYGFPGSANGTGQAADFFQPTGIVADASGNLYVSDTRNDTIRKITASGEVTTKNGEVQFGMDYFYGTQTFDLAGPTGLAFDQGGNLYLADHAGNSILVVPPTPSLPRILNRNASSDIGGSTSYFQDPSGCAVDAAGTIYLTDTTSGDVRKVAPDGSSTLLAGNPGHPGSADGSGMAAAFNAPTGIAVDAAGNAYVADSGNNTIRKITPGGAVTTLAGKAGAGGYADGNGTAAAFNNPIGVTLDAGGNLYVADSGNNIIRKITPASMVTTVAGTYGTARNILGPMPGGLYKPQYLTFVWPSTLYVTTANAVVRVNLP
ncbi:MAG TPA: DUF4214 domain-containing protein [Burkholderiaceae bacterium]|jgi:sugar lactone lactonase YvrE